MDPFMVLLAGISIVFLAGMTQGLTGFGFGLISVPLFLLILPPATAIPLVVIHGTLNTLLVLYHSRRHLQPRRVAPMIAAGLAGVPFGTYILTSLDVGTLKILIGVLASAFALLLLAGFRRSIKNEKAASVPLAAAGGVLNSSIGMSGPPVVLFFSNQGIGKGPFRANLAAYFTALNLATLPTFAYAGLMTPETLGFAATLLPAMAAGAFLGMKLTHRVNEKTFKKIALMIATAAGAMSILSGLGIA